MHISSCTYLQIAAFKNDTSRLLLLICFLPGIFCVTFLSLLSLNFTLCCNQVWYPVSLVPASLYSLWLVGIMSHRLGLELKPTKKILSTKNLNGKNPLHAINIPKKTQHIYIILVCMHAIKYVFILKLQFMFTVRF